MKIISLFFHLSAVVWTTRWAIVKICSAIVRISSEPVEISSELVEISSELVWISSELVLRIAELLIISVFKKNSSRFPTRRMWLGMKIKANNLFFTFVYPFVKSALRVISSEMLRNSKWLEVTLGRVGGCVCPKWLLPLPTQVVTEPFFPFIHQRTQCKKQSSTFSAVCAW